MDRICNSRIRFLVLAKTPISKFICFSKNTKRNKRYKHFLGFATLWYIYMFEVSATFSCGLFSIRAYVGLGLASKTLVRQLAHAMPSGQANAGPWHASLALYGP